MKKLALHVSFVALSALAIACGSAAEDTGSGDDALAIGGRLPPPASTLKISDPPPPPPPVFVVDKSQTCTNVEPSCQLQNPWVGYQDPGMAPENAQLSSLGCDEGMWYADSHISPSRIAVCPDTSAAHAAFPMVWPMTCDACLPQLPAGHFYATLMRSSIGDCESTCAGQSQTGVHHGTTSGGGGGKPK